MGQEIQKVIKKVLSNFASWGNLLKGQNNKKNNVKGCGYIERYKKKGEGGELEICTQTS